MSEMTCERHLLVIDDDTVPGRRRVLLDGDPVPGTPGDVLASLWEQGWVRAALWMRIDAGPDGPKQVLHEARLVRPQSDR